ncbi:hypothetical protein [Arthrobacter sp. JCM 19049]|uniref:hypothetical protein n=1 Tax=Arthrobacter sp. JCM 19049 TaxID=1460643 RepID=UPI0006D0FB4C|nr:hypothetical protein [Arthrobacter sp. JCM 19049]
MASAMDLQYVGASTTAPRTGVADGLLNIGISTWDNWANLAGATELDVEFDTNGDGKADYVSFTTQLDDIDLDLVATFDSKTGAQVDLQPLNGVLGDVDTNTFDTNVAILPVALSSLGWMSPAARSPTACSPTPGTTPMTRAPWFRWTPRSGSTSTSPARSWTSAPPAPCSPT